MRAFHPLFVGAVVAWSTVAATPSRASESYDGCTEFISALPATITTAGTWCFGNDLSTGLASGAAIVVDADHVTIDCNGFKLGGLLAGSSTETRGIINTTRRSTTIRRCNVRGFHHGVEIAGTGGHLIEDNRFDGNVVAAIVVHGDGSVVRRNRINDTGGSTGSVTGEAVGIRASGGVDISDNTIDGVLPSPAAGDGEAIGIDLDDYTGSLFGNRIRGLVSLGTDHATAIRSAGAGSGRAVFERNQLTGDGRAGSTGILCASGSQHARRNILGGFPTPLQLCSNNANEVVP